MSWRPDSKADAWHEFSIRSPSLRRRHGDPFPLPRLPPHFCSQGSERNEQLRRVDCSLRSLNTLAAASNDKAIFPGLPLTAVQKWILSDVSRRVLLYGNCPDNVTEESALQELNQRANLYNQESVSLASCDLSKVKILQRRLCPQNARDLAPPEVRGYIDYFEDLVERPRQEQQALAESGVLVEPYWDPALRHDRGLRIDLYRALHRCQLLDFCLRRRARAGIFMVKKKDGMQRLIIDARQANAFQRTPPTTRLGTPASLTSLDLSPDTLVANGCGGLLGRDEAGKIQVSAEAGDVGDCFYNFVVPSLSKWFAFDDSFSGDELAELGLHPGDIFDDELGYTRPLQPGERVFAAFRGVPMGWSWALFLANEIVSYQASLSSARPGEDEVRDRRPAPPVKPGLPVVGIYVDNVHTFGGQYGDAGRRMGHISERFADLGIPFTVDNVEPDLCLDSLGLFLDFRDGATARSKTERAWKLWKATRGLLRRRRVSGRVLRVWLGLINFHFQLFRPALASLSVVYRFMSEHLDHRAPLWPSVRREMKVAMGLIFLIEWDMGAPCCNEVHIGDSSDRGYSLMTTSASTNEIRRALQHRERWRFAQGDPATQPVGPPCDGRQDHSGDRYFGSVPNAGVGRGTSYGQELASRIDLAYQDPNFIRRRGRPFGNTKKEARTVISAVGIPELEQCWDIPDRWTLLVARAWKHTAEHINIKEARVCLMGLRRLCRSTQNMGTNALSISDNLVSCLVFEKGRSSSKALNRLCRRAAAYQLGCRIQWRLRHIPTGRNIADGPSRLWGPDFPRHGQRERVHFDLGDLPKNGHFDLHSFELGRGQLGPVSSSRCSTGGDSVLGRRIDVSCPPRSFLEIFSGTARLTRAIDEAGLRVLPDIEVAKGNSFNLLNPKTQSFIITLLEKGLVWCIHFGTPCTVWSRARRNIKNVRRAHEKERAGVVLALFTARAIRVCLRLGIFFTLENPQSSRLWDFGPIKDIFKHRGVFFFTTHMCAWGSAYKKPTSILTNLEQLCRLQAKCNKGHKHVPLRGIEAVYVDGKATSRNRTAGAGAYPHLLCAAWARELRAIAPSEAWGAPCREDTLDLLHGLEAASLRVQRRDQQPAHGPVRQDDSGTDGDRKYLLSAARYIQTHPVIFGHFTAFDIARLAGYNKAGEKTTP